MLHADGEMLYTEGGEPRTLEVEALTPGVTDRVPEYPNPLHAAKATDSVVVASGRREPADSTPTAVSPCCRLGLFRAATEGGPYRETDGVPTN